MLRKGVARCLFSMVILMTLAPYHTQGALDIVITQGTKGAIPIAVVPFGWSAAEQRSPPEDLATIIASNLGRSGRFAPVAVQNMPSQPTRLSEIDWNIWRKRNIYNIVIGNITPSQSGYDIEFRLFDTLKQEQIAGLRDYIQARDLRRTGHQISDIVYETLTGERGAFDTQIAYITEIITGKNKSVFALNVADSDGHNAFPILESSSPIMSPAWAPNARELAYVSFENKRPSIFVQNLSLGTRQEVAAYPGINGAPAWSPDGTQLALTLSKDGNPEIYILNLKNKALKRLTHDPNIDTEPTWSPNGRELIFTSDRGGRPQLYRIGINGDGLKRLTFKGGYNARAIFAPDSSRTAFVHANQGKYHIAVLELTTGNIQVLTRGLLDESPTFAPNGRMILYAATDAQGATLAAVSVDGRVRQRIAAKKGRIRDPAWSPFASP